ncbi:MAG TPA: hypothetical protein VLE21_00055 [Candidatus Nitrosocosmicus sp.]|nr:hypothetical protein [Candidatus Nitrosocosmicus sp.]
MKTIKSKNKAVLISVRSDSVRLPNKCFMTINGRYVLEHVIDRAKEVGVKVILCTTDRDVDDKIEGIAYRNDIVCYRGSLNDKLLRWFGACTTHKVDYFVTFDADDLFCDISLMNLGLSMVSNFGFGIVRSPKDLICGAFTYAMSVKQLAAIVTKKNSSNTQMIDEFIDPFSPHELFPINKEMINKDIRLTLDYPVDYDFFVKVFEKMKIKKNIIPTYDIVMFLKKHKELIEINSFKMKEWKENQDDQKRSV